MCTMIYIENHFFFFIFFFLKKLKTSMVKLVLVNERLVEKENLYSYLLSFLKSPKEKEKKTILK